MTRWQEKWSCQDLQQGTQPSSISLVSRCQGASWGCVKPPLGYGNPNFMDRFEAGVVWWKISCVGVGTCWILFSVFHLPGKDCHLKILRFKGESTSQSVLQVESRGSISIHLMSIQAPNSTLRCVGPGSTFGPGEGWTWDAQLQKFLSNVKSIIYEHHQLDIYNHCRHSRSLFWVSYHEQNQCCWWCRSNDYKL